ncbi:alpha/beta hydrolase [Rhodococcus daqingensis]|uniref:Alpha/beta hydrolase n=1 Tax=Rhodococcus daqingensis TaxID=2479363 RepID=A0ABW2S2T6_9NOCA
MLEVIDRGPGSARHATPLLFIHGAWHGAWCWDEHFLDYFADEGYRALAVSLRGHGNSPAGKPIRTLTIADYVADVVSVADSLPVKPVVIGHSMGGFVVQKYLESHDAPAGVLLASTPPAGWRGSMLRGARRHPLPFLKASVTRKPLYLVDTPELARAWLFSAQMRDTKVVRYAARLQNESDRALRDMLFVDPRRTNRVTVPVLVLGADHDTAHTPGEIRATASAYGTQAEFFPNMAHDMMLETGWRDVAGHIAKWLGTLGL